MLIICKYLTGTGPNLYIELFLKNFIGKCDVENYRGENSRVFVCLSVHLKNHHALSYWMDLNAKNIIRL